MSRWPSVLQCDGAGEYDWIGRQLEGIRRNLEPSSRTALKVTSDNGIIFLPARSRISITPRARKKLLHGRKSCQPAQRRCATGRPANLLKVRFESVDPHQRDSIGHQHCSAAVRKHDRRITTGQFSPQGLTFPQEVLRRWRRPFESSWNLFAFCRPESRRDLAGPEQRQLAEVLAQPNIIAANGKEASSCRRRVSVSAGSGSSSAVGRSITIQFKEIWLRLNFIRPLLPRGTIRLQVAPEVSTLDFTNGIEISGFDVPA